MLARGAAPRREVAAPPPDEGPGVDDLTLPESAIRDRGIVALISLVQQVQQLRIVVYRHFDDSFERLVTAGDADGYPPCVERFKPKFLACDSGLERVAMRLDALQQAPLGNMVRDVIRRERKRYDAKCDEQVCRQRLSVTDVEADDHPELKKRVQTLGATLASEGAAVEEALEEL